MVNELIERQCDLLQFRRLSDKVEQADVVRTIFHRDFWFEMFKEDVCKKTEAKCCSRFNCSKQLLICVQWQF